MKFTATQIAAVVQGKIEGNENTIVHTLSKIEEADEHSLCFLANLKYEEYLYQSKAGIIIISNDLQLKKPVSNTLIRVSDPYASFTLLLKTYEQITAVQKSGIHEKAIVSSSARIGKNVYLGPGVVIDEFVIIKDNVQIFANTYVGEQVIIGANTKIYSNVSLYNRTEIGEQVIIHAGAVLGSDGFGHAPQADGSFEKIPQLGNVVIEDKVEIGANCTIDRATMGSTIIKRGAKLDNLIQIAHNVVIGENTVIAAQAGISGSTKIGKNNMIGGQAGIVGHISTANGVKINAQSGLSKTIKEENIAVTASPAFNYTAALRSQAVFKKLPELQQKIAELEAKIKELKKD